MCVSGSGPKSGKGGSPGNSRQKRCPSPGFGQKLVPRARDSSRRPDFSMWAGGRQHRCSRQMSHRCEALILARVRALSADFGANLRAALLTEFGPLLGDTPTDLRRAPKRVLTPKSFRCPTLPKFGQSGPESGDLERNLTNTGPIWANFDRNWPRLAQALRKPKLSDQLPQSWQQRAETQLGFGQIRPNREKCWATFRPKSVEFGPTLGSRSNFRQLVDHSGRWPQP